LTPTDAFSVSFVSVCEGAVKPRVAKNSKLENLVLVLIGMVAIVHR